MAKLLDRIIVVDVESTCWEGSPPAGEESDVIEIGVCTLDLATLERADRRALLVRPERSSVSPFCTELTTIRPDDVADAPTLREACKILRADYASDRRVWASWGDYDRRQIERCCAALGCGYPFGTTHWNAKSIFAVTRRLDREVGMARALALAGLPLEGTHHRGVDDAWNIAALLATVLRASRPAGLPGA